MTVGICLRGHRDAPPGRAVAAILAIFFVTASFVTIQPNSESRGVNPPASLIEATAVHPLDSIRGYFIENRGQVNGAVRYYSRGNPAVAFRDDGVMFVITEAGKGEMGNYRAAVPESIDRATADESAVAKSFAYMLHFEESNKVTPTGNDRLPFDSNFFIGSDPANWKTGTMNFREIVYENLYDGIDLIYRLDSRGVKYEFIVSPGSDPQSIGMKFEGIDSLGIDRGVLLLQTPFGVIREERPWSYQDGRGEVDCRFAIRSRISFGYVCDSWDRSKTIVVDPLVYSTFLGGSAWEAPSGWSRMAIDTLGYVYVTTVTDSGDFPVTMGAFDRTLASWDAFVTKLNPTGSGLVYSTYLGGGGSDASWFLAVDDSGCAYVTGTTTSDDFPVTPGSLDVILNGGAQDAFVTKLNATGSGLLYSTYLGGSGPDRANSIAVDQLGNAYLAGTTNSTDFPTTPNAFRSSRSGIYDDAFVAELNADGSALIYSTYFGGSGADYGHSITIDDNGVLTFAGQACSADMPITIGAYDTTYAGGGDIFVARMNSATGMLIFSTFVGWNGNDGPYFTSIALNSSEDIFVTGTTTSVNFPVTAGSFDMTYNGGTYDAFVFALNSSGDRLVYSTMLGGGANDATFGIVVDSSDNAFVVGTTSSSDFPTSPRAPFTSLAGNSDIFVTEFDKAGAALGYSTYLGGTAWEQGTSIAVDNDGMIYVAGNTDSTDFPTTPGAFDTFLSGPRDASLTKLNPHSIFDPPDLAIDSPDVVLNPPASVIAGTLVTIEAAVHNFGGANASDVAVRFHDGPPSGSNQIGTDQVIPFIPYFTGTGTASAVWISGPPGLHDLCAVADPEDVINESREDNNMACVPLDVVSPPDLMPGSLGIIPPTPLPDGTPVRVNVTVSNEGDLPAGVFEVLLFDDKSGDGIPDAGEQINISSSSGLAGHSQSEFVFDWDATPIGLHTICIYADPPPGVVDESNETNNAVCIDIVIQPGPVFRPDYIPVSPLPIPPVRVGLSSQVSLSIQALNQGAATASSEATLSFYNESTPSFVTFTVSPIAPAMSSPRFTAKWISPAAPGAYRVIADVDCDDNVTEWDETNNLYTWTIEVVAGPLTSLVISSPNYTASVTYVKSSTPLDLSALDQSASGINHTWYRIDNVTWVEYSFSFFLSGEGDHYVEYYSEDNLGNVEDISWRVLRVDDTPPATTFSIGDPKYLVGGNFTKSSTPLTLQADDGGVGTNSTFYRLWNSTWSSWREYTSSFTLTGRDGTWLIEFLSIDFLGNREGLRSISLILDDTPPATTISPATAQVESGTYFTLEATDSGSGVNYAEYRVDGGIWTIYTASFTLSDGGHNITYRSVDNLGNLENEKYLNVTVSSPYVPPAIEANYKPLVALVFAIILAVVGLWSSKRRPWKGGKDRMAVMKALMLMTMPFVLAEAATGVVSLITGTLSIPPLVGTGTAVDLMILLAGTVTAVLRVSTKTPRMREERDRTDQ